MTPYDNFIQEANSVMRDLIVRMSTCPFNNFKNVAAVYLVWQDEHHKLQMAAQNWIIKNDLS